MMEETADNLVQTHVPDFFLASHVPDFSAITRDEQERGYSSRCEVCGRLLPTSIELIGSSCRGKDGLRA
jgi:hypothetical protein